MENTEVEHEWEQAQDDEQEEGLVARRKNFNQTSISTTIGTNNIDSVHGEDHHQKQQQDEEEDFVQQKDDGDEMEKEKQQMSGYSVYYDTDKGVWKCRICSWDNQGRTCLTHHNQHPKWHSHMPANVTTVYETKGIDKSHVLEKTDITINNQENGNGMHFVISKQNGEHQEHEMSFEGDKGAPSSINSKTETTEIEVIKDGDDEIAEYDVETVLKKQDTHDLFCPNCNSCITKRVILRKRKRRIPVPGEDAKRSKPQTSISSESNVVLGDSSDNQALNGVDSRLDDVQPSTSIEYDHQREPDVFRCLSCFSIFMPTGNGFKMLRVFGNKNNQENNEQSQKEVPVKKSWFSKLLRSAKVEHNVADLNDSGAVQSLDLENNFSEHNVSSNLNSSIEEKNTHASTGTTDLVKDQHQSDKVMRESNGMITTLADPNDQLLTSYHIEKEPNSKSEYPGMFVVKPPSNNNEEPVENSVSPLQHDGLKLLVPPNVGSLVIDNSKMNQELDVTVQTDSQNEKERINLSFSPPDSKLGQLTSGHQTNGQINLVINGKEQTIDKDIVQPADITPEVSQDTVLNNVEIHLEEPLKFNKDVLTDKQINLLEEVKNIERTKGKDTIITIGSKQLDASVLQRPPNTLGVTATPALQQALEQGGVTTATGESRGLDVIKCIVYGGLIELIASLSVVSSAAGADATTSGADATTLNVLALGLANIFGGLFVISHDLWNLKSERSRKREDRYQLLLGQRADFPLHMAVALLSYLIFGFLPPIVYGFSFYKSNDKDLKLLTVAAASIVGIMILAGEKAYVQSPRKSFLKTIGYHVVLGFMASGVSYVFGGLIIKLLEKMDIFHDGSGGNLRTHGASSRPALATF